MMEIQHKPWVCVTFSAEASAGVREAVQAAAGQEQAAEQEERRPDSDHPEAGGEAQGPGQGEPGDGQDTTVSFFYFYGGLELLMNRWMLYFLWCVCRRRRSAPILR